MAAQTITEVIMALEAAKSVRIKHGRTQFSPSDSKKKRGTADLRKIEHYANFWATYLVYKVDSEDVNLTTNKDTLQEIINFPKRCLTNVLRDVFSYIKERKNNANRLFHRFSIIHLYM